MRNAAALAASLAALFSTIHAAETIHAVVTVQRHGDRTFKGNPPTSLTPLGKLQCYNAGSFYRSRYLNASSPYYIDGINEAAFNDKEVYAMAPDQPLLVTSGQVFLQGLYPPQEYGKPKTLANGDTVEDPANGVQFTTLHTMADADPNTIWLKGDDGCTKFEEQSNAYYDSPEFHQIQKETQKFYDSLKEDYLNGVFKVEEIGYQSAYEIFDYINVGSFHNSTIASRVSAGELFKLKVLADRREWAMNGNASSEHPALTVGAKTMTYKIVERLSVNLKSAGVTNKFTLMIASYDAFLAFFGHSGLSAYSPNFMGLPNYAASMVFELFSDVDTADGYPSESALKVRFLFRNGTEDSVPLSSFPIFGETELSWKEFNEKVNEFAVKDTKEWCNLCSATEWFCSENTNSGWTTDGDLGRDNNEEVSKDDKTHAAKSNESLSPAAAGAIGAVSAIVFILLGLGVVMAVFGLRFGRTRKAITEKGFKGGEELHSETASRA